MQKSISVLIFLVSIFLLGGALLSSFRREFDAFPSQAFVTAAPSAAPQYLHATDLGVHIAASTPASLYAKSYCVIDADSGRVLAGKQENERMAMASTTKIMTCILALESGKPEDTVSISAYAASMPDVQLNIREGETYRLKDLLYSLMLESHNDTAVAIAEHLGGTVEGFAAMMNAKAKELGCTSTHFVTPNGLDDPAHYTTARELCLIGAYAIQNPEFQEIIQTSDYSFRELSGARSFHVTNHDAFLQQYDGAIGIKTGFTGNAGYCFCGAAKKDGRTLVSAVLACGWPPNKSWKWADTRKLMDYGFAGFQTCEIPLLTDTVSLPVTQGQQAQVSLSRSQKETDSLSLPLRADDTLIIQRSLPGKLTAPVRSGDIIGSETYMLNGICVKQVSLTASHNVAAIDLSYVQKYLLRLFLPG